MLALGRHDGFERFAAVLEAPAQRVTLEAKQDGESVVKQDGESVVKCKRPATNDGRGS